jgi:hypothetical protein
MSEAIAAIALVIASVNGTAPAVRSAETVPVGTTTTTQLLESGRCGQWEQTAIDVGWPVDDWPTLDRIIWCESRCNPAARNRSGASGLAQVEPMWWHGRDPLDPAANLAMALQVHAEQGWRAWSCY